MVYFNRKNGFLSYCLPQSGRLALDALNGAAVGATFNCDSREVLKVEVVARDEKLMNTIADELKIEIKSEDIGKVKMYVDHLSSSVDLASLGKIFGKYGKNAEIVTGIKSRTDRNGEMIMRHNATVTYEDLESVYQAIRDLQGGKDAHLCLYLFRKLVLTVKKRCFSRY